MNWRDVMGMRETAEHVAWKMVLGSASDAEIEEEMIRRTVEYPHDEWSVEEIRAAIATGRTKDPGDEDSRLAVWNAEQDEAADRFVDSAQRAGFTVVAAGRHMQDAVRRHRATRRRETMKARVSSSTPLYIVPRAPRSRERRERHVARRTSSSDSGDHESEGDGDPPPPVLSQALRGLGLALRRVRWCRRCHCFAYAIDRYQCDQLDALGFRGGLCPSCWEQLQ
jgi:hypothetical protein